MSPKTNMQALRSEAQAQFDPSRIAGISGSDKDSGAIALCRKHIKQAGFERYIQVDEKDLRELSIPQQNIQFLTNPPYGERLGDKKIAEKVYRDLGELVRRHPGSRISLITAHHGFERFFGKKAQKKRRLYNGRLECEFLTY